MEIKKQIELTQAIYEILTGKKLKQAKEETLATIFGSLTEPTPSPTPIDTEQNKDIQNIYENQTTLDTAISDLEFKTETNTLTLQEMETTLQEIIREIRNLKNQTIPRKEDTPKPTGMSETALKIARDTEKMIENTQPTKTKFEIGEM